MKIAVVTDLHSTAISGVRSPIPARRGDLALELVERFVRRMNLIERPDFVLALGDLVDAGDGPLAVRELEAVKKALSRLRMPYLALRGNHDGPRENFEPVFGPGNQVRDLGPVRLVALDVARYNETYCGILGSEGLDFLSRAVAELPVSSTLIVALHNPCHAVANAGPYELVDREAFLEALARAPGKVLVVSGHDHRGVSLAAAGARHFLTVPALCEKPFRYAVIDAVRFEVRLAALSSNRFAMPDQHLHTRFAQCNENMDLDGLAERMDLFGVPYLALTEHSHHLYGRMEGYDSRRAHQMTQAQFAAAFPAGGSALDEYLAAVAPYRERGIFAGLELESNDHGEMILHPEYAERFDFRIGSVHEVPALREKPVSLSRLAEQYLEVTAKFLGQNDFAVFGHPTRIFKRAGFLPPPSCYGELIGLLLRHGVAAEINPHDAGRHLSDDPDPDLAFLRECVARGVRLSYGSDSHNLNEVGEFAFVERIIGDLGIDPAQAFYRFRP